MRGRLKASSRGWPDAARVRPGLSRRRISAPDVLGAVVSGSASADERECFVAELGHGVFGGCFDVEAEQGFGVGGPEVEPAAVAEVDGESVEAVGCDAGA